MRNHLWMHVGLVAAIAAIFGLSAVGVAVPTAVVYAVVLACPLMMVFMMFGMNHDHEGSSGDVDHSSPATSPPPRPPVDSPR